MKKIFLKIPDTPEEIRDKITWLSAQVIASNQALQRQRTDLLVNHLLYDDYRIAEKKKAIETRSKDIKTKEAKIKRLESKLKQPALKQIL